MFQPKIGFAKFKGAMRLGLMALLFLAAMAPGPAMANLFTLNPVADARVGGGGFQNTNFGTTNNISVNSSYPFRSFLRFNLSVIPDSYLVTQAVLHLYRSNHPAINSLVDMHHVSSDSWIESGSGGITYATAPGYGAQLGAQTILKTAPADWTTFDLFGIAGWNWSADLTDNAVSLLLKLNNETTIEYVEVCFWSKENGSLIPYLEITANPVPVPPAVLLLGSGLLGLGLAGARRKFGK